MTSIRLGIADIPDGGARILQCPDGSKAAVFRVGERVAAIANRCPHLGGSLGEGPFDGTTVKCPLHGFRVNVWTGKGTAGKPVATYAVTVCGQEVEILVPNTAATGE